MENNCIFFVTGNKNKLLEAKNILNKEIESINIDLKEIQSVDVREVIENKVKEAYDKVKKPVLVEDTALEFESLNGLPGALIKWFLDKIGNEGLLKILSPFENKKACAITCVAYFDGKNLIIEEGKLNGSISNNVIGENGFGWDSIFIPENQTKTLAEMTSEEKNSISMRKIAFEKIAKSLNF